MPMQLVTVEHRETDEEADSKVECLERELRVTADRQLPGPRVQFALQAETIGRALAHVDRAIERCGHQDDLARLEPG